MTVFNFGIFRKPLSAERYEIMASEIAKKLSNVHSQLTNVYPNPRSPELDDAFNQLQAINDALRQRQVAALSFLPNDPLLSAPQQDQDDQGAMQLPAAPQLSAARQAKQNAAAMHKQGQRTAVHLEQQLHNIVDVYNKLITAPEISSKGNQSALVIVKNIFADFFTKVADLFRKMVGGRLQANWTHSPAQITIDNHFHDIFSLAKNAKTILSSKPDADISAFQPSLYKGF